jgi:oligopeptide transport system substrate-binding protein
VSQSARRSGIRVLVIAVIVIAGVLLGRSLRRHADAAAHARYFGRTTPPAEDVLRYANGAEPETLDPGLMSGQPDGRIARALFEGLLIPHPETLEPIEGMATHWELSEDGLTYTFWLREDARWTNGDPVTASDFEWSWKRVLDPNTPSRYADLFYLIEGARAYKSGEIGIDAVGIHAVDPHVFEVTLEEPTPYFIQLVTYYPFLPVHRATVETYGDRWTHPENIVSNGPFRLVYHRQNDKIVMVRNEDYWDAATVRLDRIVAYSLDDIATMLNMYRSGMTDWNPSGYIRAEFIPYVKHYEDYTSGPFLGSYFYSFAVGNPPFDDKRVRRALALAIDRESICHNVLHDSHIPWGNFVPLGFRQYPYPEGLSFDPQEAQRLLAEAGYPEGEGFPGFEILFNTSENHRKIAEAIQAMWKKHLGIDVSLMNQEWASYLRTTVALDYQVARRSWIGDYLDPNTFLSCFLSDSGNNRTGWHNAEYDSLLALAGSQQNATARMLLLADAESLLLEELPVLPIYSYKSNEFVAPYVRGLYSTATDTHPLKFVWFDREGELP